MRWYAKHNSVGGSDGFIQKAHLQQLRFVDRCLNSCHPIACVGKTNQRRFR
nr:MAG TPA: hypothetical protein [Caudoviricetes sp.]